MAEGTRQSEVKLNGRGGDGKNQRDGDKTMNLMLNVLGTCIVGCAALGTLAACSTESVSRKANPVLVSAVQKEPIQTGYSLSNSLASEKTKAVYRFLCENYGKKIISGQQESTWMGSPEYEMNLIQRETGKMPAMRGFDYMNDDFAGVTARAKEWWNRGGLVTICWHVGIFGGAFRESQNDVPDFRLLLNEETEEHRRMVAKWDQAARSLAELQDAGVVVLWRPFHEFDGGWFWWGKGSPDDFIRLWRMMYKRYTEKFHLNNLIWVLGYSGEVKDGWYVGDEYCDIIGSDTYDGTEHRNGWDKLLRVGSKNKPFAFHECGKLPSIHGFVEKDCLWSWFLIWHTTWANANRGALLREFYNDERVLTLEDIKLETSLFQAETHN